MDEPTRGVDVGAKAEIHKLLDELACHGVTVLVISSELPEVINLSRRIVVLRHGRIAGELQRAQVTQPALMRLMADMEPLNQPAPLMASSGRRVYQANVGASLEETLRAH